MTSLEYVNLLDGYSKLVDPFVSVCRLFLHKLVGLCEFTTCQLAFVQQPNEWSRF